MFSKALERALPLPSLSLSLSLLLSHDDQLQNYFETALEHSTVHFPADCADSSRSARLAAASISPPLLSFSPLLSGGRLFWGGGQVTA